ncbi:MAG: hypothetical protein JO025_09230 [Verrucomicrobia bacterium]|nr:hypothetical protein [Verrucomicrobiota bacterium]
MFTAELLERWLGAHACGWPGEKLAKPWPPSIAKLLNAYGQALSVSDNEVDVMLMLQKLAFALQKNGTPCAAELKQNIIGWLKEEGVVPPATINAFSLDAPNHTLSALELKQSTDLHQTAASSERAEIARLRSSEIKANGRKLAEAAIALRHKIRWLERGQEAFLGVSTEAHPKSGRGVNQFALWLQGMDLDGLPEVRMNCWESVFYTACKANLMSRGVARGLFGDASNQGQIAMGEDSRLGLARNRPPSDIQAKSISAYEVYITKMYRYLKGDEAVNIKRGEDRPKKGDLVFVDGMSHVCICVGKKPVTQGKDFAPYLMSLWHHDDERYTLLTFDDLLDECRGTISIRPCPF